MATLTKGDAGPSDAMRGAAAKWTPIALGVLMCLGWGAVLWTVPHLHADPALHTVARFAHLAGLVVGFGAVLTVDWLGLRWLLGHRAFRDVLQLAQTAAAPIWAGLATLVVSGLVLHPDLASWPTRVKLGIALVIGLNGLYAHHLTPRLAGQEVPRSLLIRAALCGAVSQAGWWSATIIGFLNAHHT